MPGEYSGELRAINNTIKQLANVQVALGNRLGEVSEEQRVAHEELRQLARRFVEFELRDHQQKIKADASTKVVDLRLQLKDKFGHYEELRRMATGIVEAVDARLVTNETVQSLTESAMTTTPGYWLAPALVGLAAWIRDERPLAEDAVRAAMQRDGSKSSLFYALVLRRFGRTEATAHWIRRYVERQDPSALPREFAVILDAVATGALGMECRPLVLETVGQWYDRLSADPSVVAEQVKRWRKLIRGLRTPVDPRIEILPKVCPDWSDLKKAYENATVHGRADLLFRTILEESPAAPDDLRERVDRILDSLVTEFDQEEAPLRLQFDYYQAIVDHDGDKAAAQAASQAAAGALDDTTDYLSLLTNAAFFPEKSGSSPATRQLAVALARTWIVAADVELAEANRAALPKQVAIKLAGWTGDLAAGIPLERMEKALDSSVMKRAEAEAAKIKAGPAVAYGWIGAAVFLLITIITAVHKAAGGVIICSLITVCCAVAAINAQRSVPLKQEEIREKARKQAAAAKITLRRATAEYTDLMTAWQAEDEKAAPFTDYLSELKVSAFLSRSPDQVRGVLT